MQRHTLLSCVVLALVVLGTTLTVARAGSIETEFLGRGALRNDKLTFPIAQTLKNLFFEHTNAQYDLAVKYGSFGPLSFSGGSAGVVDQNIVTALTGELFQLFTEIGTPDLAYTDIGFPGQELNVTTPAVVAGLLAQVVVQGKIYGQYPVLGEVTVKQLADDLYRVGGSCDPVGRIFPDPTPGVYPTDPSQLAQYHIYGHRFHVYERHIDGKEVTFKLKAVEGYGRFSEFLAPAPLRTNETPFSDLYDF